MKHCIIPAALALALAQPALAQDAPEAATPEAATPEAAPEPAEPESTGISTGAVGDTFFIRAPLEYHMLASDLPGRPVYFDTTMPVGQTTATRPPEDSGVEAEIRQAERPLGTITDVLLDRAGQVAALVIELDPEMRGGDREVAVAGGLVRMLPVSDDPAETVVLLTLDPVDLENAPAFERPQPPGESEAEAEPENQEGQPEDPSQN
jgi:nicotinate-nucleotide--dimethylbenzimidazole phosphoribosyltransferase